MAAAGGLNPSITQGISSVPQNKNIPIRSYVPQKGKEIMGRPTNERKDRTFKLRMPEEMYERLERESGGNMSEYVRSILSGENKAREERPKANVVEIPEVTYKSLEEMCMASGLTMGRFMEYVKNLFHEGKIYIDGLTVKTKGEYDLTNLIESCHRVNVDPQEMINKLAASLNR